MLNNHSFVVKETVDNAIDFVEEYCKGSSIYALKIRVYITNNAKTGFSIRVINPNAVPIVVYHDFIIDSHHMHLPDKSFTDIGLFSAEMKYLHDNGFRILKMSDIGC
ncbi:MAG TPA: hypothetical protein VFJ51_05380 [Nitrososphaeraceae archaeon]|nr:hypothetical protein [Nitrososphaeraceae archaeon]